MIEKLFDKPLWQMTGYGQENEVYNGRKVE